ncbi:hypothetical protein B0H14DRAFT_77065 [Mycena olivaceomarginata]|nr:hypothetical protein B0H14DRAFT_77065 [Mycena olivaceomarginata]
MPPPRPHWARRGIPVPSRAPSDRGKRYRTMKAARNRCCAEPAAARRRSHPCVQLAGKPAWAEQRQREKCTRPSRMDCVRTSTGASARMRQVSGAQNPMGARRPRTGLRTVATSQVRRAARPFDALRARWARAVVVLPSQRTRSSGERRARGGGTSRWRRTCGNDRDERVLKREIVNRPYVREGGRGGGMPRRIHRMRRGMESMLQARSEYKRRARCLRYRTQ